MKLKKFSSSLLSNALRDQVYHSTSCVGELNSLFLDDTPNVSSVEIVSVSHLWGGKVNSHWENNRAEKNKEENTRNGKIKTQKFPSECEKYDKMKQKYLGIVILREFHHCVVHDGRKNEPCLSREICDVDNICSSYQRNDDNDNRKEKRKIWWGNSAAAARLTREKIDSRQVYFDNTNIIFLCVAAPNLSTCSIWYQYTEHNTTGSPFLLYLRVKSLFSDFSLFSFFLFSSLFSCARSTQRKLHHRVRKCGGKHCLWDYGTYTKCCELYVCSLFCFSHNKCCHFCVFNLLFAQFRVQLDIIVLRFSLSLLPFV